MSDTESYTADFFDESGNPLDSVEEVLHNHDWIYDRPTDSEIFVQASGDKTHYRMTFTWQDEFKALQFYCEMDEIIPPKRMDMALRALREINQQLWLGHFDIPDTTRTPLFRYTYLCRGAQTSGTETIEDMVEIALAECERFHAIFALLATAPTLADESLELVMMDHGGTA